MIYKHASKQSDCIDFSIAKSRGFTLAEVLITLAVIGIIASMTIPALVGSADNTQTVAGVRKVQAVLSQAMMKYQVDNDCVGSLTNCGAFDNGSTIPAMHQAMWDKIKQVFNISKDCGTAASQGCFPDVSYKRLNNNSYVNYNNDNSCEKATLADGMILMICDYADNCVDHVGTTGTGPLSTTCGNVTVDINGQKGPNQWGRDLFMWYITDVGVYPAGALDHASAVICNPAGVPLLAATGLGCAAKVLQDGAVNY